MAVRFTESAKRHGYELVHASYAITNAVYSEPEFTDPRPPARIRPNLYIGPAGPYDRTLLEVFVEVGRRGDVVIFHVMRVTEENLNRMGRSYTDGQ